MYTCNMQTADVLARYQDTGNFLADLLGEAYPPPLKSVELEDEVLPASDTPPPTINTVEDELTLAEAIPEYYDGFTIVPNTTLLGYHRLSDGAKLTYYALLSFDWQDSEGRVKGYVFPSVGTLAARRGKSRVSIQRHLAELEEIGLIRTVARHEAGQTKTNLYYLERPTPPAAQAQPVASPLSNEETTHNTATPVLADPHSTVATPSRHARALPTERLLINTRKEPTGAFYNQMKAVLALPGSQTLLEGGVNYILQMLQGGGNLGAGGSKNDRRGVSNLVPEEYQINKTRIINSNHSNPQNSKASKNRSDGGATREKLSTRISHLMRDLSRLFNDYEHLPSNLSQVQRLYTESGMSEDGFVRLMTTARQRAQMVAMKHRNPDTQQPNRAPYFFTVLGNLVEQEHAFKQRFSAQALD